MSYQPPGDSYGQGYPPISPGPVSPPPGYPPPYQVTVVQLPTSGAAVASMVLGMLGVLVGCCSFGVLSVLAVVLGHVGLRDTADGTKSGHGMAVAGLILGYVLVVPMILFSIWMVLGSGMAAISSSNVEP
ncbi:protein of unknown function [Asanoa hainanensis]|uniref:DUF4190 domain-containing protein n=1 Tax=Asanoa hainanensis TaxID=560556 RepID=A0A239LJ12_9ACTN|nr:DUF4190 domain-containing protein [Asanoa hainanensis]SNT29888.1 protein of unknown function [Asanoa hainanensis]